MRITAERPEHEADIRTVLAEAFGGNEEAMLVDRLRANGNCVISLVAELPDGGVAGHILLSRLMSPDRALALAPLAIDPKHQHRGAGSALVREALERAAKNGDAIVFVLGAPSYYERFGFSRPLAAEFRCRYGGEHFMARPLNSVPQIEQRDVIYPPAFDLLG